MHGPAFVCVDPPRNRSRAVDPLRVAGAPVGKFVRGELGLNRTDQAVRQGDHAEQEEELAEAVLGSHQQVAEKEKGDPLKLLPEAADDLEQTEGVRVRCLDDGEDDKGDHPAGERRQSHRFAPHDHSHQGASADRGDHQVAQARDRLAVCFELDHPVDEAEVEDQDGEGHLVAGAGGEGDQTQQAEEEPGGEEEIGIGNLGGDRDREQQRQRRRDPADHQLLPAAA